MFRDRTDAGEQLVARFKGRTLHDPLVLAIPRGGVIVGAVLAKALHADLDVILSRKLRAPGQPELALGAVSESGEVYLEHHSAHDAKWFQEYIDEELTEQLNEIARRRNLFRSVLPPAPVEGRSIILTDDGLATGATMIAAAKVVKAQRPREVIVAVPVASPDRLNEVRQFCSDALCVLQPRHFHAIGQFYEDFTQIEDEEVVALLREVAARHGGVAAHS